MKSLRPIHRLLYIISAALLFSCTAEKSDSINNRKLSDASNRDGSEGMQRGTTEGCCALDIISTEFTRNSILILKARGFDLSEATIVWMINGRVATDSTRTQLKASEAKRGDEVQAKAILRTREVLSDVVKIRNAPPEVESVKFLPEAIKPGGTMSIEPVGTDADGDAVTFLYEWTLNGEPAGKGNSIERPVKRHDNISVKITPFDGQDYGSPVVIQREIRNLPPVIIDHKEFSFDGKIYTYQVRASDLDGDTLTYSLESASNGMTIDSDNGLLTWIVPPEFKGKKNVSIIVSDGHGGTAHYNLGITIR